MDSERKGINIPFLSLSILHTVQPAFEDGTDRRFRNVEKPLYDAGEIPRRTYTIFRTRRKSEIKKRFISFKTPAKRERAVTW
jgi:hypothetical protein